MKVGHRFIDRSGERIGYLKILKLSDNPKVYSDGKRRLQWDYKCDCGNVGTFPTTEYWKRKRNKIKSSCGCNINDYRTTLLLNESGFNICYECKKTLPLSDFGNNKTNKNGLQRSCRKCKSKRDKKYRNDPRFRERILEGKRNDYSKKRNDPKEWERYLARQREIRDYKHEYQQVQKNPMRKSKDAIRKLLLASFKVRGIKKSSLCMKSEQILGCSFKFFREHIESQFKEGMSWLNHGKWHLDHKVPLEMATSVEELIKLNHWTNFQPLWADDNYDKSSTLQPQFKDLYKTLINRKINCKSFVGMNNIVYF